MPDRVQYPALQGPPPFYLGAQAPEDPNLKWYVQTEEPVRVASPLVEFTWFVPDYARLLDAEFPSADKWAPVYPNYIWEVPRPVDEGLFLPDPARLLDPENPTLDKWWRPSEEPVREVQWPVQEGLFLADPARLLDAEDPNLKWYMPAEEPIWVAAHLLANGLWEIDAQWTFAGVAEDITLDKWWMPSEEPLRVAGHLLY